jgi:predicted dehydrogenase
MSEQMNRRAFFKRSAPASLASTAGVLSAAQSLPSNRPLRLGFVGVGGRGTYHLDTCLGIDSIEVKAICDINPNYLWRASRYCQQAGKPVPKMYDRGKTDYLRMIDNEDLDVVITATPWQYHTPICVAAMKAGKHAATEVPAALTLDECWELVETSEKTGKQCLMLEQVNYIQEMLVLLNMAQQGIFGEILHATGGYVHDLRLVKFDPEREPWRVQFDIDHNGNLYPTHPIGPISFCLDINRGDRYDYLVSMSSKSMTMADYADTYYGERSPYAAMKYKQGDCNTTLLHTEQNKTVNLYYDTNTPHPHTSEFRLQGTKGLYAGEARGMMIEGRSPETHKWEPMEKYAKEFEHPIWKHVDPSKFKSGRGHGGGSDTPLMWTRWFRALKSGAECDMDVYDAATWSAIFPLSEKSVARNSDSVDFPDFTRGKYKNRKRPMTQNL